MLLLEWPGYPDSAFSVVTSPTDVGPVSRRRAARRPTETRRDKPSGTKTTVWNKEVRKRHSVRQPAVLDSCLSEEAARHGPLLTSSLVPDLCRRARPDGRMEPRCAADALGA